MIKDTSHETARARTAPGILFVPFMLLLFSSVGLAQGWELAVCAESNNLPFSNSDAEGFENRIAEVIADELGATATFTWYDPPFAQVRDYLMDTGECDLLMGITDGHAGYLTTIVYYRTIYHFMYRDDSGLDISSFDDEELADLSIGVQVAGGGGISPITQSLARRGLVGNQVGYTTDFEIENPLLELPEAVVDGEVDVAVVPGPVAGYFQSVLEQPVEITPVSPQIDFPLLPMYYSISIGVRTGDEAFRDELNLAITERWEEIQGILDEYGVSRMPLPSPVGPGVP